MDYLYTILPSECGDDIKQLEKYLAGMSTACEITEWKGHKFGAVFSTETVQYACTEWEVSDGDIIIATYPRCGTNWVKECVRQLLYGHDKKLDAISSSMPMPLRYIESGPVCSFKLMDNIPLPRRIFLTHLPANLIDVNAWFKKDIRIINVIRNPKDQAVSWYHFSQNFPYAGVGKFKQIVPKEWNKWIENYMAGIIPSNMKDNEFYPDNILTWFPYWNHPKVLPVVYEEMLTDTTGHVKKIANFIGTEPSVDVIERVVANSSHGKMKSDLHKKNDPDSLLFQKMELIRKGGVGGWKKYFTVAQSERMDEIMEEKLADTEIKFIYE